MSDDRDPQQTLDHSAIAERGAGLFAAFGPPTTPGGFTVPPVLPDPDSGADPVLQPGAAPAPTGTASRYQLLGELARGGMGVVLKARDPDLGRDLAVKVLREELRGRPAVVRRFVEEAQVGGQLQHPGCVPVYELGSFADGRPYFTMKLVRGRTLAALLTERPTPGHDLPRFLQIFEAVCQAVAYAHSKGVIHRDLKPANVMVGSFGEVQVMDWGLAKVLPRGGAADEARAIRERPPVEEGPTEIRTIRSGSSGGETEAGSVIGTPAYMPPEQAGGEVERVNERADVFGLGAILCVVLTGEPPYTGPDVADLRLKAIRGELADAFARLDRCGADGELIGLTKRCLAVDPQGRPRHAGEVAAAVAAYRAGVEERARKAELERAAAEARAAEERRRRRWQAAVAVAVLGLLAVGGLTWYRADARDRARSARVELALHEAELLRDRAKADPTGDPAKWREALEAVRRADGPLEELGDPATRERAAALRQEIEQATATAQSDRDWLEQLADIRSAGGDDRDGSVSDAAYADSFRAHGFDVNEADPAGLVERLRTKPPAVAIELAADLETWAYFRRTRQEQPERARPLIALARALDPSPQRDRIRALLYEPGNLAERREAVRQLADEVLKLPEDQQPGVLAGWPVQSIYNMFSALLAADDRTGAVAFLRVAQRAHPRDVWVNWYLAQLLAQQSPPRREEAIRYYAIAQALRPETGYDLAIVLEKAGHRDEAITVFRDICRLRPENDRALVELGRLLLAKRGARAEALATLDRAIAASRAALARRPGSADAHETIGSALHLKGDLNGAAEAYRTATRLQPHSAEAHNALGWVLYEQNKYPEAIAEFRIAAHLRPREAWYHNNLGNALNNSGDPDGAIAAYREALHVKPDMATTHYSLGLTLRIKGDLDGAIQEYRTAIRLQPDLPEAHCNLGVALRMKGDYAASLASYRRGHELGSQMATWKYPSARWVSDAERLVALEARLPAVLRGDDRPKDAAERISFAEMCGQKLLYATAARLYEEASAADPKIATDYQNLAAYAAARAGTGQGADADRLDDVGRARWRKQALAWLRTSLTEYAQELKSADQHTRSHAVFELRKWQQEPALACVRDAAALAKLPAAERAEWERFWRELAATLDGTGAAK